MSYGLLKSKELEETLSRLRRRIAERFPESGLFQLTIDVGTVLKDAQERVKWITKPNIPMRVLLVIFVLTVLGITTLGLSGLNLDPRTSTLSDFVQMLEAGTNDLILLACGFYFLFSFERRLKRQRALRALYKIRSLIHLVDMLQLTKDPIRTMAGLKPTASSPEQKLGGALLSRYLDYCSELLSILAKIGVLYGQHFDDPVVLSTVDSIEDLSNGISTKLWQKIMISSEGMRLIELS